MKRRRKTPPHNLERCCVGACNKYPAIFYYRHYPICGKHWDADCDDKFKYKHFQNLRDYLGLPPIEKPEGYEHMPDEAFSQAMDIAIDVQHNVPVLVSEKLVLWSPSAKAETPKEYDVHWNGKKQDPIELYTTVGGKDIVLLRATGKAVKFSSEKAIRSSMDTLQELIGGSQLDTLHLRVAKKFKKSRFWQPVDCESQIKEASGSRT